MMTKSYPSVQPVFVELDEMKDEDAERVQNALLELTGQKTVPNVFVYGKHLGE